MVTGAPVPVKDQKHFHRGIESTPSDFASSNRGKKLVVCAISLLTKKYIHFKAPRNAFLLAETTCCRAIAMPPSLLEAARSASILIANLCGPPWPCFTKLFCCKVLQGRSTQTARPMGAFGCRRLCLRHKEHIIPSLFSTGSIQGKSSLHFESIPFFLFLLLELPLLDSGSAVRLY